MKFMAGLEALGWDVRKGRRGRSGQSENWTVKWPSFTRCCHTTKLNTILTNLTESERKEDPATQPPPLKLLVGAGGRQGGGHVPKAQGLKRRSRGSRPCNREGARGG